MGRGDAIGKTDVLKEPFVHFSERSLQGQCVKLTQFCAVWVFPKGPPKQPSPRKLENPAQPSRYLTLLTRALPRSCDQSSRFCFRAPRPVVTPQTLRRRRAPSQGLLSSPSVLPGQAHPFLRLQ